MKVNFKDWVITLTDVDAFQYDNLSRVIDLTGNMPEGYEWDLLVQVGGNADILRFSKSEKGYRVVLTEDNLSLAGMYYFQLRGRLVADGVTTQHTNIVTCLISDSLTGIGTWPNVPSEFKDIEKNIFDIANHPPIPGENGYWMLWDVASQTYIESTLRVIAKGNQGDPGPMGPAGPAGKDGPAGPRGADGKDGPIGPIGPQGIPGNKGPAGPAGAPGPKGDDGAPGPTGPAGADGGYYTPGVRQNSLDTIQFGFWGNKDGMPPVSSGDIPLPPGPAGPTGPRGADGKPGKDGPIGPDGPAGEDGGYFKPIIRQPNGPASAVVTFEGSKPGMTTPDAIFVMLPKGPKGQPGDPGKQGPQGISGVWVGSGEPPADNRANVLIDPNGTPDNTLATMQDVDNKISDALGKLPNPDTGGQYELIDRLAIGYETLYEKPADWDTNFSSYYREDLFSRIVPCESAAFWAYADCFKKISGEFPADIRLSKEPNGKPYAFKYIALFGHVPGTSTVRLIDAQIYSSTKMIGKSLWKTDRGTREYYGHHMSITLDTGGSISVFSVDAGQGGTGNLTVQPLPSNIVNKKEIIERVRMYNYPAQPFEENELFEIWAVRV